MKKWLAFSFLCFCFALVLAPGISYADSSEWIYDQDTETLTNEDTQAIIKNVTANGSSLSIGINIKNNSLINLDLSGAILDKGGKTYEVASISDRAFSRCNSLVSVTIPESVTNIGSEAFQGSSSLESVVIPDGITDIKPNTFAECFSLKSVNIPKSVTSIGAEAFRACFSLESIIIPEGVTVIPYRTFADCGAMRQVSLPSSLIEIGSNAFVGCVSLSSVEIPENVKVIDECAFAVCENLELINIPSGVTSIGLGAFGYCCLLEEIEIPVGVTEIKEDTFANCFSLKSISLPEGVTNIGDNAFEACTSLETVDFPSSVTNLGSGVFYNCPALTEITIPALNPPTIGGDTLSFEPINADIIVPSESLENYKDAPGWNNYKDNLKAYFLLEIEGSQVDERYLNGTEISISAEYKNECNPFNEWELEGSGIIKDEKKPSTVFIMGESDAKLTATYIESHTWDKSGRCEICNKINPDFKPIITEGGNSSWKKGSDISLSFTSNAALADFLGVEVDGKLIDESNYEISEGSTVLALKPLYLESLDLGKHELLIRSETGSAETVFTISAASTDGSSGENASGDSLNKEPDNGVSGNNMTLESDDDNMKKTPQTNDGSTLLIAVLTILASLSLVAGGVALKKILGAK